MWTKPGYQVSSAAEFGVDAEVRQAFTGLRLNASLLITMTHVRYVPELNTKCGK
jgi:hypothetical protein